MGVDTDFLSGFAAGPDFPNDPSPKYGNHLGFMGLVASPTQATNPYNGGAAYADTEFHTKTQLVTFLRAKYATIAALNVAWRSTYTTFGTQGAGWGSGTGLLDEDGRASHTWLGTANGWMTQTDINANVKADLDGFLYEIAKKYFQVTKASFQAVAPSQLYFGPTSIGGWRAPGRCPILKAAGEVLDVVNIGGSDFSQAQVDYIVNCAGDVPLSTWEGVVAQADSGRYRYTKAAIGLTGASFALDTQEARGAKFLSDITAMQGASKNGVYPFVGYLFWQFTDNSSEQTNWGLISLVGNAYDGKEARVAGGVDSWGYPTGGEERDYGDFITFVKEANLGVHAAQAP